MKIRTLDFFSGIGAFDSALNRLGIDYELVDAVDIDRFAVKSFNAVHGTNFEPQDITQWDKDVGGEIEIMWQSSPCQDLSVAGKMAGAIKGSGTRSSLVWEAIRIASQIKPKIVIWENVKGLVTKKNRPILDGYIEALEKLGYTSYWKVLNSKWFCVPQNRERVFVVSIRNDVYKEDFVFPEPTPLKRKLKDILEDEVDESFYLSDKRLKNIQAWEKRQKENGRGFRFEVKDGESIGRAITTSGDRPSSTNYVQEEAEIIKVGDLDIKGQDCIKRVYSSSGVSPTLTNMQGGNRQPKVVEDFYKSREPREYNNVAPTLRSGRQGLKVVEPFAVVSRGRGGNNKQHLEPRLDENTNTLTSVQKDNYIAIKTATSKGYDLAQDGDGIDLAYPQSTTRRGRVGHGVAKTLATSDNQGALDGLRIRKLTPKECWRLQGFLDDEFEKARKVNSDTQLYKEAGNSVTVSVIVALLTQLGYGDKPWNEMSIGEREALVTGDKLA